MIALKYKKSEYIGRINTLNLYKGQLSDHLSNLEDYRSQIKEFWEDSNADQLYRSLSEMINKVHRAIERTEATIVMCQNTIETIEAGDVDVGGVLESALGILGKIE